ncbi:MAG: hypothetical protein ACREQB_00040 [Candidatus Binataceae bacterium]
MIEEVLQFVLDAGGGVPLHKLRAQFPLLAPALRTCLQEGRLEVVADCYRATPAAVDFLRERAATADLRNKRCPGCLTVKPAAEYWSDASHPDRLYAYCIVCAVKRKARIMLEKKLQARSDILQAAKDLIVAVQHWDSAVATLAVAWREVMHADQVLRENRNVAGITYDSGRMDARLLHPRATFSLSLALMDAGFPLSYGVIRECGMPAKLADYVGDDPASDYFQNEPAAAPAIARPTMKLRRKFKGRKGAKSQSQRLDEAEAELAGA